MNLMAALRGEMSQLTGFGDTDSFLNTCSSILGSPEYTAVCTMEMVLRMPEMATLGLFSAKQSISSMLPQRTAQRRGFQLLGELKVGKRWGKVSKNLFTSSVSSASKLIQLLPIQQKTLLRQGCLETDEKSALDRSGYSSSMMPNALRLSSSSGSMFMAPIQLLQRVGIVELGLGYIIINMSFTLKEVVWAKVKGYPWWPAVINKLPEQNQGNFKVLFIAEDNYANLEPRAVKKFQQNYRDYTKGVKTKKLLSAIVKAQNMLKHKVELNKRVKKAPIVKEVEKPEPSQAIESDEESENESEEQSEKEKQVEASQSEQNMMCLEKDVSETVDRMKIENAEAELRGLVSQFQNNRVKEWKYVNFFKEFKVDHLTNEELLQSNLTRMLRYIIDRMRECQIDSKYIEQAEKLSADLKSKIMEHLTNTNYYDQYLKVVDKNRQNKADIESQITKALKKASNKKVKRQFVQIFVQVIGNSVTNGVPFKDKEFLADLKDNKYSPLTQHMISKAATQRFADQIVLRYQ